MKKYDIIIVLSPEISKERNIDKKFPEFANGMYVGGLTRMKAACKLFKNNKESKMILVGGCDENKEKPEKTEAMGEFLLKKCNCKNFEQITSLPCSRHNLIAVFNRKKKELKGKRIGILTNFYHLPRVLMFWKELTAEEFKEVPMPFSLCAESIIGRASLDSSRLIKRINSEIKGLGHIEENSYRDKCLYENWHLYEEFIKKNNSILLTKKERKQYEKKLKKS